MNVHSLARNKHSPDFKEGATDARNLSVSLYEISERVSDFKGKRANHTDKVVSDITRTIALLKSALAKLADRCAPRLPFVQYFIDVPYSVRDVLRIYFIARTT